MELIQGLVDGFIITVGITRPKPEKKRAATIFIAAGLVGTVITVAGLFLFAVADVLGR